MRIIVKFAKFMKPAVYFCISFFIFFSFMQMETTRFRCAQSARIYETCGNASHLALPCRLDPAQSQNIGIYKAGTGQELGELSS